jgi:hypothetical protein
MVRTSVLNDALNSINNAEKAGKRQVINVFVPLLSFYLTIGCVGHDQAQFEGHY